LARSIDKGIRSCHRGPSSRTVRRIFCLRGLIAPSLLSTLLTNFEGFRPGLHVRSRPTCFTGAHKFSRWVDCRAAESKVYVVGLPFEHFVHHSTFGKHGDAVYLDQAVTVRFITLPPGTKLVKPAAYQALPISHSRAGYEASHQNATLARRCGGSLTPLPGLVTVSRTCCTPP
jgi:hypothetical protein